MEISSAEAVERVLRSTPTPSGYGKANAGLLHGLAVFITGLTQRNTALAGRNASHYTSSYKLIDEGLALQKAAIAKYPAYAKIST